MVNQEKLTESIEKYKEAFENRWEGEQFKWKALKCFKDNWDINADNFYEMFTAATEDFIVD